MTLFTRSLTWMLLPWLLAATAQASDGVVELNDASARAGSITAGDAPGYPVTISSSGSYRLTGDLFVSGTNTDVVEIIADDVSLDLNRFAIKCLWFGTPCAGNGTGIGVEASGRTNVAISNGVVRDMAATAIVMGSGIVERVRALGNGNGIEVVDGEIRACFARDSLGFGIRADDTVVRNTMSRNNGIGVECGLSSTTACVLSRNVFTRNLSS